MLNEASQDNINLNLENQGCSRNVESLCIVFVQRARVTDTKLLQEEVHQ